MLSSEVLGHFDLVLLLACGHAWGRWRVIHDFEYLYFQEDCCAYTVLAVECGIRVVDLRLYFFEEDCFCCALLNALEKGR